ncbi:MAG: sugar phosphate isomerase/epimerase [Ruminococcaceae bacterium]|nr:sugar phosphate isomerase/epimerase [Oscillospiraceae bacterium]
MTNYSIQLYSIRDLSAKDFPAAIKAAAEIGYSAIEFAGFFGYEAETVKKLLDENNIAVSGTHTGWQELTDENIDKTIAYHKTIGNKYIIVPGGDFSTKEKLDAFIELIKKASPKLKAEGITLGYHNHSHEFVPNTDGLYIFDELFNRTDIALELDTFWAYAADKDPVGLMEKIGDRLIFIHLKDGIKATREGRTVGNGDAPVVKVIEKAIEMNVPMVVESETLKPDGVTEAKNCMEFLRQLGK